jgi:hypothetical protein
MVVAVLAGAALARIGRDRTADRDSRSDAAHDAARRLLPPDTAASPAVPVPDPAALRAELLRIRGARESLGSVGTTMLHHIGPGMDGAVLRRELARVLPAHRAHERALIAAMEPLESPGVVPVVLPHAVVCAGARLASERLLARADVDRAERALAALGDPRGDAFFASSLQAILNPSFARSLLRDVDRQHDWVVAVATQVAERPAVAGEQSAWALLDVLRAAAPLSRTPIEGLTHAELVARGRSVLAGRLAGAPGPAGAALRRLMPDMWTLAVQGGAVPASRRPLADACAAAAELAPLVPGMADALGTFPARLRVQVDWPR